MSQLDEKNSDNFDELVAKVPYDNYTEYFKPENSDFLRRCFTELVLYFMFQKRHVKIGDSAEAKSDLLRGFYIPFETWILSEETNKDRQKYQVDLKEYIVARQNTVQLFDRAAYERPVSQSGGKPQHRLRILRDPQILCQEFETSPSEAAAQNVFAVQIIVVIFGQH